MIQNNLQKRYIYFFFGHDNSIYLEFSNNNQYIDQIFKEIDLLN